MSRWSGAHILFVLGCCALSACKFMSSVESGVENLKGTLANGSEPFVRQFVTISAKSQENSAWSCSGVLLGPQHVLTAAHCVDKAQKISVKRFDQQMRSTEIEAVAWQTHPDWKKFKTRTGPEAHKNDLGIVVLDSELVGPFAKISVSRASNVSEALSVALGRSDSNRGEGQVRYASNIDAFKLTFRPDGGTWISRGLAIMCNGDVGGPLFAKDGTLLGIAAAEGAESNRSQECSNGKRVYHADVQESIVWLVCAYTKVNHPMPNFPIPSKEFCK